MKHYLHPGIEVSLRVDGVDLPEYDIDEDEDVNTSTKYVEATSGANFTVYFKARPDSAPHPQDEIEMRIYLDGKWTKGRVHTIRSARSLALGFHVDESLGVETNTAYGYNLEKFAFAELKTNDGPVKAEKIKEVKDLGEVSVKCFWARVVGESQSRNVNYKSAFSDGVSEKSLKGRAISQHATLKPPEHHAGSIRTVSCIYPYGKEPFAEFKFRYRSRKDLQIEGIIPRSPSPVPLEDRDPDDLSLEESRELLRRMRERQASAAQVKREGVKREGVKREGAKRARSTTVTDDGDSDDDIEITAGPSKRRHTSGDSAVEIVDLTED